MKDLKISTELASAVLSKEVTKCSLINKSRNSINITCFEDKEDFNPICKEWNIYEFAFKCKEWAYKNFKIMLISHYSGQCYINGDLSPLALSWWNNTKSYQVESDTEIKAIIKACNWILKEL